MKTGATTKLHLLGNPRPYLAPPQRSGPSGWGCVDRAPDGQRVPPHASPFIPFQPPPTLPPRNCILKNAFSEPPQVVLPKRIFGGLQGGRTRPPCVCALKSKTKNGAQTNRAFAENISHAFTLIESLVVIVLLGIISTAAALTFRSSLQSAAATDAIEQINYLDSTSRQRSQRFNQSVDLIFDLTNSTLSRREGSKRNDESFIAALPRGFSIEQINIAGQSTFNGEASLTCSPTGLTPSYALHLIGPNFDQWLLFAGLSGQMTVINNEEIVQDILAPTRIGARRNPD